MSISDDAAAAQHIIDKGEEALRHLDAANLAIAECRELLAILSDGSEAANLREWMTMLNQAHSTTIIAKDTMPFATGYGERFVRNLFA